MRRWQTVAAIPLLLATAMTAWHGLQAGGGSLLVLAGSLVAISSALLVGVVCCSAVPLADEPGQDVLIVLTVGVLVYQVLLLGLAFVSPFSFHTNVVALALVALAGTALLARRGRLPGLTVSPWALTCSVVCVLAAGFWSRENLQPLAMGDTQVVAHTWQDMFFHARQVAFFGLSQGAGTLSDFNMAGARVPTYHYAGYMIPAAIRSLGGGTGYSLAAAVIAPLGAVLTGFAAYAFGKLVSGKDLVGLLACGLLLLLPDASYQGLGNRWTGYTFFQQVGVTGPYAVAAMGLGWALVLQGLGRASWGSVLPGLLLCGLGALFKVQIFVAYAVVPLLFAVLFHPALSTRARLLSLAGALGAYAAGVAVMPSLPGSPTFTLSTAGFDTNFGALVGNYPPDSTMLRVVQGAVGDGSLARRLPVGAVTTLLSSHGLAILALGPVWWLARRRGVLAGPLRWFPWFIVGPHLVIALAISPNTGTGDAFEVIHKTFVWPVWALTVWLGATLALLFVRDASRASFALISAALIAGTLPLYWLGSTVQSAILWSRYGMDLAMPRALYEAALFVRDHSSPGAVVQLSENDPYLMVPAFSERPFWMARSKVNSGEPGPEPSRRLETLKGLGAVQDFEALAGEARRLGITWWIQQGPAPEAWHDRAAFTERRGAEVRVFPLE